MIYAFDISMTNTGICIFTNDAELIYVGSIDTKSEKEHQNKLKIIADKLIELRKIYEPEIVVFERGFYRYATSTETIFKVFGLVQYLFNDIKQLFYPPMTVKKAIFGRGNAKKEAIRDEITKIYSDISFKNLDETDACAVGLCYFRLGENNGKRI